MLDWGFDERNDVMPQPRKNNSSILVAYVTSAGIPEPELEYAFHPDRKWRFDLAWPDFKIAVEIQGATWTNGRHTRGKGYANDCEKLNAAQMRGWICLYTPTEWWKQGSALDEIIAAFNARGVKLEQIA